MRRALLCDRASKAGTLVNGQWIQAAFLRSGDELGIGVFALAYQGGIARAASLPAQVALHDGTTVRAVDTDCYLALAKAQDRSVVRAFVEFLRMSAWRPRAEERGADLARRSGEGAARAIAEAVAMVTAEYDRMVTYARVVLPRIVGIDHGADGDAWLKWWASAASVLPAQIAPAGWLEPLARRTV